MLAPGRADRSAELPARPDVLDIFPTKGEPTPMIVDPNDGRCRTCGGTLLVIDADDATLTVSCLECQETYAVETDAFGDGCMSWPA
jgi:hypothetical protein